MPRRDAKCPSPRSCSCLYSTCDFNFGSPIPSSVTAASRYAITSLIVTRAAYSTLSARKSNSPSLLSLDTVLTNVSGECPGGVSAAVWACPHRRAASTGQRRSQRLRLVSQHHSDLLLLAPWKRFDEFANSGSRGKVSVDRSSIGLDAEFMGWSTDYRNAASQEARIGTGITVMQIYASKLRCLAVALPPLSEQRAIARLVDHATAAIDGTIELTHRQIALAHEYRILLVSDVVTGQLDVREAAADLPGSGSGRNREPVR